MLKIRLVNDFHNSVAYVLVPSLPAILSQHQVRRAERKLCGVDGCCCSGALGVRGRQSVLVEESQDGEVLLVAKDNNDPAQWAL